MDGGAGVGKLRDSSDVEVSTTNGRPGILAEDRLAFEVRADGARSERSSRGYWRSTSGMVLVVRDQC